MFTTPQLLMSQYELSEGRIESIQRRINYYENVLRELDVADLSMNEKGYIMNNLLNCYDALRDAKALENLTKIGYDARYEEE